MTESELEAILSAMRQLDDAAGVDPYRTEDALRRILGETFSDYRWLQGEALRDRVLYHTLRTLLLPR